MKKSKLGAIAVIAVCVMGLIAPFIKLYKSKTGTKFSLFKIKEFALDFNEKADLQYLKLVASATRILLIAGAAVLAISLLVFALTKAKAGRAFFAVSTVSTFCIFLLNLLPLLIGSIIEASIELYTEKDIEPPTLFKITTILAGLAFLLSIKGCCKPKAESEDEEDE